jgi:two-component system, sensor histidine kinase and response regulator
MEQEGKYSTTNKLTWWADFFHRGIGENYSQLNAKRVILTNSTIALTLIICSCFISLQFYVNIYPINLVFTFFGVLYSIAWIINTPQHNTRAKTLVFFSVLLHTTALAFTLGPKVDFKSFYIPISIIPFLVFNKSERVLFFISLVATLVNIFFLYTFEMPSEFQLSSFSEDVYLTLNHAFNIICICCMIILAYLFMSITELGEELLIEKTSLLEVQNSELEKRKNEQENLNVVKDRLLSIIAHDLKNPIHNLQSISDLILQNTLSREESDFIIKKFKVSAQNTSLMLDNLLAWSSAELNKTSKKLELINLKIFVNEVFQQVNERAVQKELKLNNFIDEHVSITCDANTLEIVLRNILVNAIKFSNAKQEILVRSEDLPHSTKIHITDYGIGIPNDLLEKLFEPDASKSRYGTQKEKGFGLGLMLCKQLLEKSNGTISAESIPNQTTTLTVELMKQP